MRAPGDGSGDAGTAVLEFVVLTVLVLVPIVYAVLVILQVHTATAATVTAAREAGRAFVTADTPAAAGSRARAAARLALSDQGLGEPGVVIRCLAGACLAPGSRVEVTVRAEVAIPLTPFSDGRGSIPVTATHEAVVDTYRAQG